MLLPARNFLLALTGWLVLAVVVSLWPGLVRWWIGAGILLAIVALMDALNLRTTHRLRVTREVPGRMALGVPLEVPLTLHQSGTIPARVRLWDTLPTALETRDFPWSGLVPAGGFITIGVRMHPVERGPAEFGQVHIEQRSRLGFWNRRYRAGTPGWISDQI